jgi:predicted glutamine amidotransferase
VKRTVAASRGPGIAKQLRNGVFLVVLFVFSAWSLRVALVNFETISDLTLASVLNEVLRAVVFVGPVFLYLRYVEKAPVLAFLRISRPREVRVGTSSYGTHAETRLGQGATLFASEKLDHAPSWEKLASGTLAIAHRDLRLELHHL